MQSLLFIPSSIAKHSIKNYKKIKGIISEDIPFLN